MFLLFRCVRKVNHFNEEQHIQRIISKNGDKFTNVIYGMDFDIQDKEKQATLYHMFIPKTDFFLR